MTAHALGRLCAAALWFALADLIERVLGAGLC